MIRRLLRKAAKRAVQRGKPKENPPPAPYVPPVEDTEPEEEPNIEVDEQQLEGWMADGGELVLVDIREPRELQHGVADGALLIRMNDIPDRLDELPSLDTRMVIYCAAGARSFGVTAWLRENGWTDVWSLTSGFHGYLRAQEMLSTRKDRVRCEDADLPQILNAIGPGTGPRLVNHWATWCEGCVDEMPRLVSIFKEYGQRIEFLGISWDGFQGDSDTALADVQEFTDTHPLPWASLVVSAEPDAMFEALEMKTHTVPQIWIIDETGEIVHRVEEVLDDASEADLRTRISTLLQ